MVPAPCACWAPEPLEGWGSLDSWARAGGGSRVLISNEPSGAVVETPLVPGLGEDDACPRQAASASPHPAQTGCVRVCVLKRPAGLPLKVGSAGLGPRLPGAGAAFFCSSVLTSLASSAHGEGSSREPVGQMPGEPGVASCFPFEKALPSQTLCLSVPREGKVLCQKHRKGMAYAAALSRVPGHLRKCSFSKQIKSGPHPFNYTFVGPSRGQNCPSLLRTTEI